ncbi:MAG: leucine-rich repeat protein [Muribaculaceae bacterium]|nr:leucine-rich repeat protein [Muribaculaceae bacterium]
MKKLSLLIFSLFPLCLSAQSTFETNGITYRIISSTEGTVAISGHSLEADTEVSLPSTVSHNNQTYKVVEIDANAFASAKITGVLTVPENVRVIGEKAFSACDKLSGVVLPATLDSIGPDAFLNCKRVESLTLNSDFAFAKTNSTRRGKNQYPFYECGSEAESTDIFIGPNLTRIGDGLFESIGITNLHFDDDSKCEYIGDNCFNNNAIAGVLDLPETVSYIGRYAFYGNAFTEIYVPSSVLWVGYEAFCKASALEKVVWNARTPEIKTTSSYHSPIFDYSYNSERETTTAPGFDLVIGKDAEIITSQLFNSCQLKSLTFSEDCSLHTIQHGVFANNPGINGDVLIPESVKILGGEAFANCTGLTSAYVGNNVETMGTNVFHGCYNLKSIYLDVPEPANPLFDDYSSDGSAYTQTEVIIGPSVKTIPSHFIYGMVPYHFNIDGATSLQIIKEKAFVGGNITFESLNFPPSLTTLERQAIYGGNASIVAEVTIPESLTKIESACLGDVTVTRLVIAKDISTNDFNRFDFTMAGPVVFAKNVSMIDRALFSSTDGSVTGLEFEEGNKIETIADEAFNGLDLEYVIFPEHLLTIGKNAFAACSKLTGKLELPASLQTIGEKAFKGCDFTDELILPESLTEIGDEAFKDCANITGELYIGSAVEKIGWDAFANTAITSLTIADSDNELKFGDNFDPNGSWVIHSMSNDIDTHSDVMSGVSLHDGMFSRMPLTSITVGRNISYRSGSYANMGVSKNYYSPFTGAKDLKKITFTGGLDSVGNYMLAQLNCVEEIELTQTVPPTADETTFADFDKTNCRLTVPQESIRLYAEAPQWCEFFSEDGVGDILKDDDDADAVVYDINGRRVSPDYKGFKIKVTKNSVSRTLD